jgi:shikimate dehydrogenase
MTYDALDVPTGTFVQRLTGFFSSGGRGCNVTLPWKLHAFRLADRHTSRARLAGAVNTLAVEADGALLGDNTDGAGLVLDLQRRGGLALEGAEVLLLGAGGAARGSIGPLLAAGIDRITIANRTLSRAAVLAERFGPRVRATTYEKAGRSADIVINATAASLDGQLPPLPGPALTGAPLCYDMMYAAEPTAFVAWAREHECPALDGLGMLVEQAAESFCLWRGLRPDTDQVLNDLRNRLRLPSPDTGP